MSAADEISSGAGGGSPAWYGERGAWVVVFLAAAVHVPLALMLPLRGEEPRRARIACELTEHDDWVVPRQQGEPFLSRPPLHNWLIAGASRLRGDCDLIAIRLPSLLATVLTALLVYVYARTFFTPLAGLAAGVVYATLGQVMELGPRAETEAVYTLLLGGAILGWHLATRLAGPTVAWVIGYALAAAATLAKGPQAPVYFAAAVFAFLVVRRDWRTLFHPGHGLGIAVFLAIVGAWAIPFVARLGWSGLLGIGGGDVAMRFVDLRWTKIVGHLASFPLQVLACLLPWSLVLVGLASRRLRAGWFACEGLYFITVCTAVTLPTCWWTPGASPRYLMALYPCWAAAIGALIARAATRLPWAALRWAALPWPALHGRVPVGVVGGALAVGLVYNAVIALAVAPRIFDAAPMVRDLRSQIAGRRLVSFGPVWHQFAYHYREPIEKRAWPKTEAEAADVDYFCFDRWMTQPIKLPFAWEKVAEIPGNFHDRQPWLKVVVGRRLDSSP
jgi:4-amino-4-deoxy-L-arabinose transferase-like glycosyltransferase